MTNLIYTLRKLSTASCDAWISKERRHLDHEKICTEAADHIEQLTAENESLKARIEAVRNAVDQITRLVSLTAPESHLQTELRRLLQLCKIT